MMKTLTLSLALIFTPALAVGSSVYKWTDEDGVTHFGDRQPTGRQAESINVRSGTSQQAQPGRSMQERLEGVQGPQTPQDSTAASVMEQQQAQRQQNCERAQENLRLLEIGGRLRIQENGEERFLSAEEIDAKRVEYRQLVSDLCD